LFFRHTIQILSRIKKLDIFIIRSFIQPFAATFFISTVVLLLQHLWKYIDDLVGKGLEWYVIMEFMVYAAANLLPLALPLAILLASIMTFGNLGEKYELVTIKAAGIPLRRVFYPLLVLVLALTAFAFWFSVKVVPVANLKWGALYYDLLQQKPAFDLKEGVFYNDIQGYSIKIARKSKDGSRVYDVIIYDHTQNRGNTTVILAESGEITQSEDKRYLFFRLFDGMRYEEMVQQPDYFSRNQTNTMTFREQRIVFDLSEFNLSRTDQDLFRDFWKYKKLRELSLGIDSLNRSIGRRLAMGMLNYEKNYHYRGQEKQPEAVAIRPENFYFDTFMASSRSASYISQGLNLARSVKSQVEWSKEDVLPVRQMQAKYALVWWQKYTLSAACIVLFFIGAPLGAIVRKGGFGLPVVFAIVFFIAFLIINMNGEKMVRELILSPALGMWLSALLLTPVGVWLTVKATRDSALFDTDAYLRRIKRLFTRQQQ
jgi:lipopolysaccharide export system permease protein